MEIERAAISTLGPPFDIETISASDKVAARIVESQLDAGEGPCWDAHRTQTAVVLPRIDEVSNVQWPTFTREISGLPVQAIYSFPLTIGDLQIGAVDLYAESARALNPAAVVRAMSLVKNAAPEVLEDALRRQNDEPADDGPFSRREVHQATGMVIAQLGVPAADALLMIRAHAYASGRTVREIAAEITSRRLTFERDPLPPKGRNSNDD